MNTPEDKSHNFQIILSRTFLMIAFFLAVSVRIILINPASPLGGLDPSWQLGIITAISNGFKFGSDIIFTYGPLAYLEIPYFSMNNYYASLTIRTIISILSLLLLFRSLRCNSIYHNLTVAIAILFCTISANFYYFYCYLVFTNAAICKKESRIWNFLYVVSFAPLAAVIFIKGSYLIPSIFFAALTIVYGFIYKNYFATIISFMVYVISVILFWNISLQPLNLLPLYLKEIFPILYGYTEAMAINGSPWQIVLFVVSAVLIASSVAWPLVHRRNPSETWRTVLWTIAVAAFLFFQFKIGFVRHGGGHIRIAAGSLLLAVMVLPVRRSDTKRGSAASHSLIFLVCISAYLIGGADLRYEPVGRLQANLAPVLPWIRSVESFPPSLAVMEQRYEDALARIRKQDPLPKLPGTTDIYSYNQAALIASGNVWNPRPVFQSYAAYEPSLIQLNRDHLLGANAPDNILFAPEPIDGRLPTLEDGLSWPVFMSHYRLVDSVGKYAQLRRRAVPTADIMGEPQQAEQHMLGEVFSLPRQNASILFAKMEIEPTLFGRALEILFKPTQLHMTLWFANGQTQTYRIVSTMTKSGFVLSPLARSTADFADLVSGNQDALDGTRVTSAKIWSDAPWLPIWKPAFKIVYTPLDPERYQEPSSFFSPLTAANPTATATVDKCWGNIDRTNGQLLRGKRVTTPQRYLTLSGWFISPGKNMDTVTSQVLVEVAYEDGTTSFYKAQRTPRPDVGKYFKRPDLKDVGYTARIDIPADKKNYTVTIAAKDQDSLTLCRNLSVRVQP
ncbi:hypothetical protein ABMA46_19490 [Mesorhizobium sp. CN5-321]|uniref:hypothetical protein n=1 Tax=Mesorhizobium hunchu TaxID=3157708 RepID=UPI0032B802BF